MNSHSLRLVFMSNLTLSFTETFALGLCLQILTAVGEYCICSIALGLIAEIIVMYAIQHREYRTGLKNLLVLLIGGIPIAMPTVLSVTMAIGSQRLSLKVGLSCYL